MTSLEESSGHNYGNLMSGEDEKLKQDLIGKGLTSVFLTTTYSSNLGHDKTVLDFTARKFSRDPNNGRSSFYELDVSFSDGSHEIIICKDFPHLTEGNTDTAGGVKPADEELLEGFMLKLLYNHGAYVPRNIGRKQTKDTYFYLMGKYDYDFSDFSNYIRELKRRESYRIKQHRIKDFDDKVGHVMRVILDVNNLNNYLLQYGLQRLRDIENREGKKTEINLGICKVRLEDVIPYFTRKYSKRDFFDAEFKKSCDSISRAICAVYGLGQNESFQQSQPELQKKVVGSVADKITDVKDEPFVLMPFYTGHILLSGETFMKFKSLFEEHTDGTFEEFKRKQGLDEKEILKFALEYTTKVINSFHPETFKQIEELPDKKGTLFEGIAITDYAGVGRATKVLPTAAFLNSVSNILTEGKLGQLFEHDLYSMLRLERRTFDIPGRQYDRVLNFYAEHKWDPVISPALVYFAFKEAYYQINMTLRNMQPSETKDKLRRNDKLRIILTNLWKKIGRYGGKNNDLKRILETLYRTIPSISSRSDGTRHDNFFGSVEEVLEGDDQLY